MLREHAIKVEGVVIEVMPNLRARVELANGHRLLAHMAKGLRLKNLKLNPGDKVGMEVSPFDLSKGCIIESRTETTT